MPDASERAIQETRRRLALLTLALLAALLVAMSVATVVVAITQLDAATDNALESTARSVLGNLDGRLPGTTGGDGGEGNALGGEPGDQPVGPADTFVLVLDPSGRVVQNVRAVGLAGLPDRGALSAALSAGRDVRTVRAGSLPVRLLTLAIQPGDGGPAVGAVQAGIVLLYHDQQAADLVRTIVLVGLAGLLCAAVLALVLTGRALVPIRAAFATERRFVASASHELRTPAAVIRSSAEVLEREGLVKEAGTPLLAGIVGEADRLARLVADLLSLAAERQCRVESRVSRPLPIGGDRDRLLQVMLILLDNAIRHSPAGGVITVQGARERDAAVVSVSDQGSGVPRADRQRIFEPFARAAGARAARGERAGLGLAIARAIVERHGGTIAVDDAPGGGARFTVRLPIAGGVQPH